MKETSISIYTFADLIRGGYLYVDKTALIYELVRAPFAQYFLSRPRRFGKSLLISTLKSLFLGERELFSGLEIDQKSHDWEKHPVIHLDLGSKQATSGEELQQFLVYAVDDVAAQYGISLSRSECAPRFEELVRRLSESGKVVILVDEYDKPILGNIHNSDAAADIKQVLKSFYSVIKTTESCQRFAFLTGVSKFSRVSVFSDLNNLEDLTMDRRAVNLLGYTQEELGQYFGVV